MKYNNLNDSAKLKALENIGKTTAYGVFVAKQIQESNEQLVKKAFDDIFAKTYQPEYKARFDGYNIYILSETIYGCDENELDDLIENGKIGYVAINRNLVPDEEKVVIIYDINDDKSERIIEQFRKDIIAWLDKGNAYYSREYLVMVKYWLSETTKISFINNNHYEFDGDGNIIE